MDRRRLRPLLECLPVLAPPAYIAPIPIVLSAVALTPNLWGGAGESRTWIDARSDPMTTPPPASVGG